MACHRIVVTRSASAKDVAPLRHLTTASSIIVVMPALIAASSSAPDVGVRADQVADLAGDVENLEYADRPRYPTPPQRSQPFGAKTVRRL